MPPSPQCPRPFSIVDIRITPKCHSIILIKSHQKWLPMTNVSKSPLRVHFDLSQLMSVDKQSHAPSLPSKCTLHMPRCPLYVQNSLTYWPLSIYAIWPRNDGCKSLMTQYKISLSAPALCAWNLNQETQSTWNLEIVVIETPIVAHDSLFCRFKKKIQYCLCIMTWGKCWGRLSCLPLCLHFIWTPWGACDRFLISPYFGAFIMYRGFSPEGMYHIVYHCNNH